MTVERSGIVLAASAEDGNIGVWDVQVGTFLTTYKGCQSGRNMMVRMGRDYFIAAQIGKKQAIHAWTWHKDQVHMRSITPEPITAVVCTPDGVFCAAGSPKGNIYIWETGSGNLMRSFSAHYRPVTALAFSHDSAILVSAGEDAVISAWTMMDLLDASLQHRNPGSLPQPLHSWSRHTLPVTGLFIGGVPGNPTVASASLDHSCNLWSLASGCLLHTVVAPCGLVCLTQDPWEHSLYLGAEDGQVFEESLIEGYSHRRPSAGLEEGWQVLTGHTRAVTCMATTSSGYLLVTGSDDCTMRVWDLQTRQTLLTIHAKRPVSCLLVMQPPVHMPAGHTANSAAGGPARPQPVAAFKKFLDVHGSRPDPPTIIEGTQLHRGIALESGLLEEEGRAVGGESTNESKALVAKLAAEKETLQQQLESAAKTIRDLRAVNSKMHAFMVEPNLQNSDR